MTSGRASLTVLFWVALVLALGYFGFRFARPDSGEDIRTSLSVSDVMGGSSTEGFARALEPRVFEFPRDHGPHPSYRTEWWYITGNLENPQGDPYGFQFTIFRSALDGSPPIGASSWATNQVFMGHFAVTDGSGRTFRGFERFSRVANGLAGAQADPFRVWLEDWVLEGPVGPSTDPGQGAAPGTGIFPLLLSAAEEDRGLSLLLIPEKPLVLQGDAGLSQKGSEAGNASYYYSFTRMRAEGTLTLGDQQFPVNGSAWLDREWSTSALSQDQVGWDWFALQLSDGTDLMYYQLRLRDDSPDPLSKGILVDRTGRSELLASGQVELTVLDRWQSPLGGAPYPSRWHLAVPEEDID
ncbi:MAG: carotenoid 1,2-hydratase, partial [Gemmatimonadetes bacterium]|nr:carotenoid 1,2-hydratase [Gemmatimonadota bacterium]